MLNSAGKVDPDYRAPTASQVEAAAASKQGPPKFLVELVSRGLFLFLQKSTTQQLTRLYPVAPDNADAWLAEEILRAADDPGALGVFRSVFYLPAPRPLNYLVQELFGKATLVLQGAKDPLSNAVQRAKDIEANCQNVTVTLLEAGHCPHDEVPERVNAELLKFVEDVVLDGNADGSSCDNASSAMTTQELVSIT